MSNDEKIMVMINLVIYLIVSSEILLNRKKNETSFSHLVLFSKIYKSQKTTTNP
jgi:hypothetical protein